MGSRPRFRSPCVTAPAHLLPYAPLYPLLPVLTRCAASYPPGLAARGVWALLSGVSASLGHRSATRPGVLPPLRPPVTDCPHAPRLRSSPPASRALSPLLRFPLTTSLLSPPDGVDAIGAPEGAGRQNPRFGAARHRLPRVSGAGERDA